MKASPASDRISEYGLDAVCQCISEGHSMTAIAKAIEVSKGTLLAWVAADVDRSARCARARELAVRLWDEKAEEGIAAAVDPFELARAKELAYHYRWRASKIAPKEYGDKLDLNHSGEMSLKAIPDDRIESRVTDLLGKAGIIVTPGGAGKAPGEEEN